MSVAVAVLLFLVGFACLINMLSSKPSTVLLSLLAAGLTITGGVLNIATDNTGIQIAVGVMLCVLAVCALVLFVWMCGEASKEGGIVVLICTFAFLLFAWVTTFAVLQLTIVV